MPAAVHHLAIQVEEGPATPVEDRPAIRVVEDRSIQAAAQPSFGHQGSRLLGYVEYFHFLRFADAAGARLAFDVRGLASQVEDRLSTQAGADFDLLEAG